jgi:hypothetical protein
MEIIIPAAIYIVAVGYLIVKLLTGLFSSEKEIIKICAIAVTVVFTIYQLWELFAFFRNEHGKSFTVGWFALAYFFVISFTIFALICWILRIVGNRI